jgi:hypothetical protein
MFLTTERTVVEKDCIAKVEVHKEGCVGWIEDVEGGRKLK